MRYETNFNFNSITRNARPVARHWRSWPACLLPLAWRLRTGASRDPRHPGAAQDVSADPRPSGPRCATAQAAHQGTLRRSQDRARGCRAPVFPGLLPRPLGDRLGRDIAASDGVEHHGCETDGREPKRLGHFGASAVGWDTAAVEAVEAVDGQKLTKNRVRQCS